jgi:oxygen-independent coproporphyrinogen-3 oxidase
LLAKIRDTNLFKQGLLNYWLLYFESCIPAPNHYFCLYKFILIMAGIYIHIPFCKQACHYCNFHFSTNRQLMPGMMDAIINEAFIRKDYLQEKVETIYFGGGTPSLIQINDLERIISELKTLFQVSDTVEITLESNPDDISESNLIAWKKAGINRLSIGIQSFNDEDLSWMNRAHNAAEAENSLKLAIQHFKNITIDLIYGSPTLTDAQWEKNINLALSYNIPHISCYALTVESKTALSALIEKHKKENIDTNKQAHHFDLMVNWLQEAGYEHYEISNFARPGFRSKHNCSYWNGKHYLGLGPSAHSFNGTSRQWNISNNALYIKSIENSNPDFEIENLTESQQLNEYIMTGLRTIEGISIPLIKKQWNCHVALKVEHSVQKWIFTEHISEKDGILKLTGKGKFLADGIAADLFQLD